MSGIRRYDSDDTLVFCDPPYRNTAGYGVEFGFENYEKMAEIMRSMKGKMIVTVNDIPEKCASASVILLSSSWKLLTRLEKPAILIMETLFKSNGWAYKK